jgi:hypothetical protein
MGPVMRDSLLNGIVLESQCAELEGEKIAEWLKVPEVKEEWMNMRTSWSKESNSTKKSEKFYGFLSYLLPRVLQKLQRGDDAGPSKPQEEDKPSEILEYWLPLVASGYFSDWETKQIAFMNGVPMDNALIKNWEQNRKAFAEAGSLGRIWYGAKLATYVPFSVYRQLLGTLSISEKAGFAWQGIKRVPSLVARGIRALPAKLQATLISAW